MPKMQLGGQDRNTPIPAADSSKAAAGLAPLLGLQK
jgi:hypothetical protein